jgi:hypothetical protein
MPVRVLPGPDLKAIDSGVVASSNLVDGELETAQPRGVLETTVNYATTEAAPKDDDIEGVTCFVSTCVGDAAGQGSSPILMPVDSAVHTDIVMVEEVEGDSDSMGDDDIVDVVEQAAAVTTLGGQQEAIVQRIEEPTNIVTVPVPTLQQVVIDDAEKIKQAWLARAYEVVSDDPPFTPYVSKARKKQLKLAHSTGHYNTRSKGSIPPFSQ